MKSPPWQHEVGNDVVEGQSHVPEAILASAELTEVPCSPGYNLVMQFQDDRSYWLVSDVDVYLVSKEKPE